MGNFNLLVLFNFQNEHLVYMCLVYVIEAILYFSLHIEEKRIKKERDNFTVCCHHGIKVARENSLP